MAKENPPSAKPENEPPQPKVGDYVRGWSSEDGREIVGMLIDDLRKEGGSLSGKIRTSNGGEKTIYFPKKAEISDTEIVETDPASSPEDQPNSPTSAEAPEYNSEALIEAWRRRSQEMKRNQATMLSELLAHKKISLEEFNTKTTTWKNLEPKIGEWGQQLKNKEITQDAFVDKIEAWLNSLDIGETYARELAEKEKEQEIIPPPMVIHSEISEQPTAPEIETPKTAAPRLSAKPSPDKLSPEAKAQKEKLDKAAEELIKIFRKETTRISDGAHRKLEKLHVAQKITGDEWEDQKQNWENLSKEIKNLENQLIAYKISGEQFKRALIDRVEKLLKIIVELENKSVSTPIIETPPPSAPEIIPPTPAPEPKDQIEVTPGSLSHLTYPEAGRRLTQLLGRDPTPQEFAAAKGLDNVLPPRFMNAILHPGPSTEPNANTPEATPETKPKQHEDESEIVTPPESPPSEKGVSEKDAIHARALDLIRANNLTSLDFVELRKSLGISFEDTYKLVDQLEGEGLVGKKNDATGLHEIFIDKVKKLEPAKSSRPDVVTIRLPKERETKPSEPTPRTETPPAVPAPTAKPETETPLETSPTLEKTEISKEELATAANLAIQNKEKGISISLLQRRLGIGYMKASKMIDDLEDLGAIGPYEGGKTRKVLWDKSKYDKTFETPEKTAQPTEKESGSTDQPIETVSPPEVFGPETPESIIEAQKLAQARTAYAKLEYEKKKLGYKFPLEKQKELDEARDAYFRIRKEDLVKKEEAVRKEGKNNDELRGFSSIALANEFKEFYDAQTQAELDYKTEKAGTGSKLFKIWRQTAEWYRKQPMWKKLICSTLLMGGAVGTAYGVIPTAIVGGGVAVQRFFSTSAGMIATEAIFKKRQQKKFQKIFEKKQNEAAKQIEAAYAEVQKGDPAKGIVDFLQTQDANLIDRIGLPEKELRKIEKRMAYRRYLATGAVGYLIASGLFGKGVSKGFGWVGDQIGFHPLNEAGKVIGKVFGYSAKSQIENAIPADTSHIAPSAPHTGVFEGAPPADASHVAHAPSPETTEVKTGGLARSMIEPNETISPDKASEEIGKKIIAHVKPGGSFWAAGRELVGTHQITPEQFSHAWTTSTVEIHGVRVPISAADLSHSGDQIVFTPAHGGQFELIDNPADKFHIGTHDDLYQITHPAEVHPSEAPSPAETHHIDFKAINPETAVPPESAVSPEISTPDAHTPEPPAPEIHETVLGEHPAGADTLATETHPAEPPSAHAPAVETPTPETSGALPPDMAREATETMRHYCLQDQEDLIKKTAKALRSNPKQPYLQQLLDFITNHPLHEQAIKHYNEAWQSTGLTETEYAKIKDMKTGELMKRYGRSLFEYFPDEKNISAIEIGHRRNLAAAMRNLLVNDTIKKLTVEKVLKMVSMAG